MGAERHLPFLLQQARGLRPEAGGTLLQPQASSLQPDALDMAEMAAAALRNGLGHKMGRDGAALRLAARHAAQQAQQLSAVRHGDPCRVTLTDGTQIDGLYRYVETLDTPRGRIKHVVLTAVGGRNGPAWSAPLRIVASIRRSASGRDPGSSAKRPGASTPAGHQTTEAIAKNAFRRNKRVAG